MVFETLRAPALACPPAPLLALLATGTPTGVVVDCGHDATTVTPVWRGRVVEAAAVRRDFGGHHLTARMLALLVHSHTRPFFTRRPREVYTRSVHFFDVSHTHTVGSPLRRVRACRTRLYARLQLYGHLTKLLEERRGSLDRAKGLHRRPKHPSTASLGYAYDRSTSARSLSHPQPPTSVLSTAEVRG